MTVAQLIAHLNTLPPDLLLARSCGGDCIGYCELGFPREVVLYPNPDKPEDWYSGDLFDAHDYQAALRNDEINERATIENWKEVSKEVWDKTYPLPEGQTYLVI